MKNVVYCCAFFILTACPGREKSNQATRADTVRTSETEKPAEAGKAQPEKVVSRPSGRNPSDRWQYEKKVNPDGQTVFKATLHSPVVLQFGFPYTGGSTVALTIRQREKQTTAYLQVTNGQFNRSFQGGNTRIRFDGQPAVAYPYSAAENGSATVIFFDDAEKLVRQLKTAEKTVIEVAFYGQGNRQMEFRTAGLVWNH